MEGFILGLQSAGIVGADVNEIRRVNGARHIYFMVL